jgi:hypothetical protein
MELDAPESLTSSTQRELAHAGPSIGEIEDSPGHPSSRESAKVGDGSRSRQPPFQAIELDRSGAQQLTKLSWA